MLVILTLHAHSRLASAIVKIGMPSSEGTPDVCHGSRSSAEEATCTSALSFVVSTVREMHCADEWSQGQSPEGLRLLKQNVREDLGEIMRQKDRTLKLIKRVESMIDGDDYHPARATEM